ncbi:hypothetical protein BJX66DRAFT_340790 [Aspergillus keveii]|uniref:Cyclohexanone monooxygenase n=1 Tax=Aspergillus keveii TaxID=714993 RepID=A0ABR4FXG9_9EURO
MVVFQRTPNLALPMQQETFSPETQKRIQKDLPQAFIDRQKTWSGCLYNSAPQNTFDVTPEEREAFFESLYKDSGFAFYLSGYSDLTTSEEANHAAYDFWLKKTRARISDPVKASILAPSEQPHPAAAKRSSSEMDYFEPEGVQLEDGTVFPVNVIALATGFDSLTGSLTCIHGLQDTAGVTLKEEWDRDGANTYLGLTRKGYLNMFLYYSVHGPAALSNGPASIRLQVRWIVDAIQKINKAGLSSIKPTEEAEKTWTGTVGIITSMTLFPKANSWYMGANIPGKKIQMLNFPGGLPLYEQMCWKALETWEGFVTV